MSASSHVLPKTHSHIYKALVSIGGLRHATSISEGLRTHLTNCTIAIVPMLVEVQLRLCFCNAQSHEMVNDLNVHCVEAGLGAGLVKQEEHYKPLSFRINPSSRSHEDRILPAGTGGDRSGSRTEHRIALTALIRQRCRKARS